jgi:hypothetical protein
MAKMAEMSKIATMGYCPGARRAGKSSVGGHLLERDGLAWFNPEGMRRLESALAKGLNHAFETTLGGKSVTAKILEASKTHDAKKFRR